MIIQSDYFANYPLLSINNTFFDLDLRPKLNRTGKEKGEIKVNNERQDGYI